MNSHVTLRTASPADFPRLLELFQEFATFQRTSEYMKNTLARMREEQEYLRALVVENPDRNLIGFASYFFNYHT